MAGFSSGFSTGFNVSVLLRAIRLNAVVGLLVMCRAVGIKLQTQAQGIARQQTVAVGGP